MAMLEGMMEEFGICSAEMKFGGALIGTLTRLWGGSDNMTESEESERQLAVLSGTETDCAQ